MVGEDAKRNQLMGALDDHALVKAALIVDRAGTVKARVGQARAIAATAGGTDQFGPVSGHGAPPKENVYLVGAGADFLIAIFDDGVNFDRVKKDVDTLIAELEL